jgi:class 3 adenylate cyclase
MTGSGGASLICSACGASNQPGSRFCSTCATPLGATSEPVAESRKTVTVLFVDATSSTALGERLDPESLRAVMTRYFDVMQEVIEFHGGSVEKFIGDAVMAVFGVPVVHEDDALRACRAALEIHLRLGELDEAIRSERGASVEWRMGINTGEVVAGEANAGQRIVTGDAVNVAARLEGAATPGEILMGAETHALVRASVTAEPIEPLTLKGKTEPVLAWRLEGVTDEVRRHTRPLEGPMVGRRRPLRLLDDAFREAVEERICHLFTILGVAGVGKSRLVDEFISSLGDQVQVASGRCLAYGHGITYWPVAEAIRHGAGIAEGDRSEATVARLRDVLGADPEGERIAAIVGGLLGIEDSPPAPDEMFWAIRKTFEALARDRTLLLVFDDIHWGEPTFLDLVEHIADWTRDAPILLIAMARPELLEKRPAWSGGKRWVTTMQLEPLSEVESDELVASLLGRADLPVEFRTHISHAAEGNPLFVEELLGKLIDDGFLVQAGDGWAAPGDLSEVAIPPSIQALLAARLDGLGSEERTVIERAAIEGKVFHRGAVTELAPEPMRLQVRERLASLMRMELVRPDQAAFAGEEAFRFRHLLIRDAAYQALAKQTRSELHERFAAWLGRVAADRGAEYAEVIAYHLEQAYRYRIELGLPDVHAQELASRASELLAASGERASERSDLHAAIDLLGRAFSLLPVDSPRRWSVATNLAKGLFHAGEGHRAEAMLADVVGQAEHAQDEVIAAKAALILLEVRGSHESLEATQVIREAERLGDILERQGDQAGAIQAGVLVANHLFFGGRAAQADRRLVDLISKADRAGVSSTSARRWLAASMYWGPTPVPEATARIEELIQTAPTPQQGAQHKRHLGGLRGMDGRFDDGRLLLAEARQVDEDLGQRVAAASIGGHFEGPLEMLAGEYQRAAELMQTSYDQLTATGDRAFSSTVAAWLAAALLELGRDDEAWRYATIARETAAWDDVASQVDGRRVQARLLARRGDLPAAESLGREAVAMAAATDYLISHGDALVDLASVLHASGKKSEAIEAARDGLSLYERKGVIPSIGRTGRLIASWSAE